METQTKSVIQKSVRSSCVKGNSSLPELDGEIYVDHEQHGPTDGPGKETTHIPQDFKHALFHADLVVDCARPPRDGVFDSRHLQRNIISGNILR